jgi:lipopolysaccharide/colanic/teichoic acid biosynthesis glycosyltransferase
MEREIALFSDLGSLVRAGRLLHGLKPDIVDTGTPKAGLLFGIAAALNGVPCRVYTLHGLRFESTRGPMRWLLVQMERIACACAHRIVCVSPSLRQRAIDLRLARPDKFGVIASGSVFGVSAERFEHSPTIQQKAEELRLSLGIADGAPVVGFVGRLTRDKGIRELVNAYLLLKPRFPSLVLLLVGQFEEGDPVDSRTRELIGVTSGVVNVGFVEDVVPYYHIMDVLAFPTHREGFGIVSIEAAAAGKPVVATDATGVVDSVMDGVTGFTVPVGDAEALAGALGGLLASPESARQMGEAGRRWVTAEFQPERIWQGIDELYRELLNQTPCRAGYPLKRAMDVCLSAFGLVLLTPLLAVVALLVHITAGRPVFFVQERPGLRDVPFRLVKFRTMRQGPGTDATRVTRFGRFLRRFSIDELPELWNVLKGDMSLVGPRPLLPRYTPYLTEQERSRFRVRPGMTGLAQINGRNELGWDQRLEYDVRYVENMSLGMDVAILASTALRVLLSRGVVAAPGTGPKYDLDTERILKRRAGFPAESSEQEE